jgi:hypothetical protein
MMLRKTFTCSELCRLWNINGRDLTDIVNDGKLKASNDIYLLIRQNANGYIYKSVDGRATISSPGPLTVNDENGFYFNISDVEEFERENGIPPRGIKKSPDSPKRTATQKDKEKAVNIAEKYITDCKSKGEIPHIYYAEELIKDKLSKKYTGKHTIHDWIKKDFPEESRREGQGRPKKE